MFYINRLLCSCKKGIFFNTSSLLIFTASICGAQSQVKWTTNPFDDKVFIENKGQFDSELPNSSKILYAVSFGQVQAFFTATGITYKYVEPKKFVHDEDGKGKDPDELNDTTKPVIDYLNETWTNANPLVSILAGEEQTYYNTYPNGMSGTITTNSFKKLTYQNIYPGIDAVYTFPKDSNGIKYSLVVHPGADVSAIKLKYSGAQHISANSTGDIIINTPLGNFTDHAPISYYEGGNPISISYGLNGTEETFSVTSNYNKSAELIIDPWTTATTFSTTPNRAYDVDYDNHGNVYIYGGGGPFQLIKLNAAGVIQWKYNNIFFWSREHYYGDFAVDKATGTSYLVEAVGGPGFGVAADAMKVNTLGTLVATFPGNPRLTEMWRAIYNTCTHQIVIGGGGIDSIYQACILDTNMIKINPVNVLPTATMPYHDMALMALDPPGQNCYMATAFNVFYDTNFDNNLLRVPVPALTPPAYLVRDGYKFQETNSVYYVGNPSGYANCNSMNGMGVSNTWLYTYDGYTLKRFTPATGVLTKTLSITPTVLKTLYGYPAVIPQWGGLDVDYCNNLYVGDVYTINIYDSTLTKTGSITAADTIYDLVLGANYSIIYACGVGFVSAINVTSTLSPTITVSHTGSCGCGATATVNLTLCSSPVTTATYSWNTSPVQTTQTAKSLCPGKYIVSVSPTCDMTFTDSVIIPTSTPINTTITGSDTICNGQHTTLYVTGGNMFSWNTGSTSTSITVSPVKDSTYSVIATDTAGCSDTAKVTVTVNPKPNGTVSAPQSTCGTNEVQLNATGGTTYIWKPSTGLSATNISNPKANPGASISYTVFISNGSCWDTLSTSVTVTPIPTAAACCNVTVAEGQSTTLNVVPVTAGDSYIWSPSGTLSCSNCPDPTAKPNVTTTYYVLVRDSGGCTVLDSVVVDVNGCANIWIPNAFSPNGDGLNDTFFPKGGVCLQTIEMYIFDRWGMLIAHTIGQPWNSTGKNGETVQEDTYVYLIITTDYQDQSKSYLGKVTVVK